MTASSIFLLFPEKTRSMCHLREGPVFFPKMLAFSIELNCTSFLAGVTEMKGKKKRALC